MSKTKKRAIAIVLAAVLLIGAVVSGTIAYLTSQSAEVTNTFTIGDINIKLTETNVAESGGTKAYSSFLPGDKLDKDPKVTVVAGSEKSYVFVKVTETNNTYSGLDGKIIDWTKGDDWEEYTPASPAEGTTILYKIVNTVPIGSPEPEYPIIKDNKVTVNTGITKAMTDAETTGIRNKIPELKFRAAAVQFNNIYDSEKGAENSSENLNAAYAQVSGLL